jgi:hypothetical protein
MTEDELEVSLKIERAFTETLSHLIKDLRKEVAMSRKTQRKRVRENAILREKLEATQKEVVHIRSQSFNRGALLDEVKAIDNTVFEEAVRRLDD